MREAARRQGRQPRRDDVDRPARAARASPSPPRCLRPYYEEGGRKLPKGLMDEVRQERHRHAREGDGQGVRHATMIPLLLSVRSGAKVSMPGMMDTVLNLGLTDEAVEGLCERWTTSASPYDAYRRLINMYGDVVMGVDHEHFEAAFDEDQEEVQGRARHRRADRGHGQGTLRGLQEGLQEARREALPAGSVQAARAGHRGGLQELERAARGQATAASTRSPACNGTAVNVQTMVFGNMGDDCGTGVAFTRNPSTGENKFYGEFLINAQGEDVVAGIRTPQPCR
jgi:pyruvate,orthophosphate dikinase